MWSQYYHSTVSQLLLESLLKLCSENIPCEEKLEIDGIICISPGDVTKQIVVKVHEIVDRGRQQSWQGVPRVDVDISPERSTSFLPDDLGNGKDNDLGQERSEVRRLITQDKEIEKSFAEGNGTDDSPVPQLRSLLPSRQIVPFTKKKGKHKKGRRVQRDVMQWANGHESLGVIGRCDYQISVDQPTVIEDQGALEDQSPRVSTLSQRVKKSHGAEMDHMEVLEIPRSSLGEEGGRAIVCRICHKYFDKYINLQSHNMEMHKRWTCKQCYSTFSMRCNLRRHERLHAGHKPHPCRICDKAFSRKGDLRIHEMKHEAAGDVCSLICEACNQFFSSRSSYDKHVCAGHPGSGKVEFDLDEDSSSMPASTDDMPSIEVPSSQISNQEDSNNSSLDPSGSSIQGEANPSLSLLSDSLASGLASGGKVFTKIEKDASPSQSLLYNENSNWSSFLTVPSPQRSRQVSPVPGSADVSQDSNNISSNSGSVAKTSGANQGSNSLEPSEDKEFTCCLCKLPFYGYGSYDEHCQRQHLRFPCHLCDQTFTNRNNRSRHVRNHTGNKCYACEKCGKSFTRSDILREHQIIHTESYIGDTCTYCGLSIKKKAELLAHIKKCSRKRKSCLPLESATADFKSVRSEKCSSPSTTDNGQ